MEKIRVTISDDHAILRTGLRAVMAEKTDLVVVGEADSAATTVELIRAQQPDVAIVDVSMDDATGISVLPTLLELSPDTRILMLTMHAEHEVVAEALRGGAHGYLSKQAEHEEVVAAIRVLAKGRSLVSVPFKEHGLTGIMQPSTDPLAGPARPLSAREKEVLSLFAKGHTHREIARALGVRLKTVETYRSRLGDKLGARSKAELVDCAWKLGLLQTDGEQATGP